MTPVVPFHLHYTLSRRQRLATEIYPWLPAIAGSIGFVLGALYLATTVSPWLVTVEALAPFRADAPSDQRAHARDERNSAQRRRGRVERAYPISIGSQSHVSLSAARH